MPFSAGTEKFHHLRLEVITKDQIAKVISLWNDRLEFQQRLFDSFPNSNPFFPYLENNRSKLPLRSILSSVKTHFDVFAIMESPYLDLEFWDSHVGYYGTCFSHYPRECSRIHFFSGEEKAASELKKKLEQGRDESVLSELKAEYRGYCVLRPIPSFVVGRTAIQFDDRPPRDLPSATRQRLMDAELYSQPFLKATQSRKVMLFNASLSINAPEFIQQDPHLGHCGTASIWVSTNIGASKFGTSHFRFPTITRHAVGKPLPSQHTNLLYNPLDPHTGLSLLEIKNALSAAGGGYQEVCPGEGEPPRAAAMRIKNFIYSFVESGLPVIIGLKKPGDRDGHVVAAIGHSLPALRVGHSFNPLQVATSNPKHAHHYLVSDAIDLYYVHDDCYGPYNRVQFQKSEQEDAGQIELQDLTGMRFWKNLFTKGIQPGNDENGKDAENVLGPPVALGKKQEPHNVATVLTPVHVRVRNHAWNSLLLSINKIQEKFGTHLDPDSCYLWRSMLMSGSEFKNSLRGRRYGDTVKEFYARLHLPKYLWVHEYTVVSRERVSECFTERLTRDIDGEFLFDATSPSYDVRFLSGRLQGACWDNSGKFMVDDETALCSCISDLRGIYEMERCDGTEVHKVAH